MFSFKSVAVCTDVTCVKLIQNFIYAGIGSNLYVFNTLKKCISCTEVFNSQKIYGIKADNNFEHFLVYGGKHLKVLSSNFERFIFKQITAHTCEDWILDAKWIDTDRIVTMLMHNICILWTGNMDIIEKIVCEERCLLYSGHLINNTWKDLIVLSGTVFSEVLIWWPWKSRKREYSMVLHKLIGHKGVIFSLSFNSKASLICSTSDDRTAMFWSVPSKSLLEELQKPNIEIQLKCAVYGHNARIFTCMVLDEYVLTGGEDSFLNIWTLDGTLIKKFEAHQGAPIWSLDCSQVTNTIVTGGGDSGLMLFSLKQNISKRELKSLELPKKIAILRNSNVIAITEIGTLFYYDASKHQWSEIASHDDLKNYSLLEVSYCRNLIAFAGFYGNIHIYRLINNTIKHYFSCYTQEKSRIFSFHWLSCKYFLTCMADGSLCLWRIENKTGFIINKMQLPPCKERWTTAACFYGNKYLAAGDRKGNVHLYSLNTNDSIQTLKKAHSHLGVTNLYYRNNELISLGRNSVLKRYLFDYSSNKLLLSCSDKLPVTWLAGLYEIDRATVLSSFLGSYFTIWDYRKRCTLLEVYCGGGHRSWDLYKNNDDMIFSYIKDKSICVTSFNWKSIYPEEICSGFHASEINSVICISNSDSSLLISGGEDTTLRLTSFEYTNPVAFVKLIILKSHLSSIRVVKSLKLFEYQSKGKTIEKYLIFSGGGRAQLILWELQFEKNKYDSVICREKFSYHEQLDAAESETRLMDLYILLKTEIFLIAAYSDGSIKVFVVKQQDAAYSMEWAKTFNYRLKCILKVGYLCVSNVDVIVSVATDGNIVLWNFEILLSNELNTNLNFETFVNNQEVCYLHVHQSSITCFASTTLGNGLFLLLTGGDDNAVVANLCKINVEHNKMNAIIISTFSNVSCHCAQITGITFWNNYFLTTSIDQRLNIYSWKVDDRRTLTCQSLKSFDFSIADIQGMQCFSTSCDHAYVLVYGKGLEVSKITKDLKKEEWFERKR